MKSEIKSTLNIELTDYEVKTLKLFFDTVNEETNIIQKFFDEDRLTICYFIRELNNFIRELNNFIISQKED